MTEPLDYATPRPPDEPPAWPKGCVIAIVLALLACVAMLVLYHLAAK